MTLLTFGININNTKVLLETLVSNNEWTILYQSNDTNWYNFDIKTRCEKNCIPCCTYTDCVISAKVEVTSFAIIRK